MQKLNINCCVQKFFFLLVFLPRHTHPFFRTNIMSSDSKSIYAIEKLNDNNYQSWAFQMEMLLMKEGAWEAITALEMARDVNHELFEKDRKALCLIGLSVDVHQHVHLRGLTSGFQAWRKLKAYHVPSTLSAKIRILKHLFHLKYEPATSMQEHLRVISEHLHALEQINAALDEEMAVSVILASLNAEYEPLITALEAWDRPKLTLSAVKSKLLEEYLRKQEAGGAGGAGGAGVGPIAAFRIQHGDRPPRNNDRECTICGRRGHTRNYCRQAPRNNENANVARYALAARARNDFDAGPGPSHSAERFRPIPGPSSPQGWRFNSVIHPMEVDRADEELEIKKKIVSNKKCYRCSQYGHLIADCPKRLLWSDESTDSEEDEIKEPQSAKIQRLERAYPVNFKSNFQDWLMDSGASNHMSCDKSAFVSLNLGDFGNIQVANGQKVSAKGQGTIKLLVGNKQNDVELILSDVLFVPDLNANLLSVEKITNKGISVIFSGKNCYLRKGKIQHLIAVHDEGIYKLLNVSFVQKCNFVMNKISYCIHAWHRRLAHRNINDLRRIKNLKITPCNCSDICEACVQGKMSRLPFPKAAEKKTKILECVSSDIGELPVKSLSGSKYFITFIDLYSGYTEVNFLKLKSEAVDKTINFLNKINTQLKLFPEIFRSDRGGEYLSNKLQNFLSEKGIKFECTAGYSPQQNGVAERKNRTLVEATRTMLIASEMPKYLWAEAMNMANTTFNSLPLHHSGKSPHNLFFDSDPQMEFHEFGSEAFVKIPDEKRKKLDIKSEKMRFLGPDVNSKAFRFFSKTGAIKISRDVKFIDEEKPNTECKDNPQSKDLQSKMKKQKESTEASSTLNLIEHDSDSESLQLNNPRPYVVARSDSESSGTDTPLTSPPVVPPPVITPVVSPPVVPTPVVPPPADTPVVPPPVVSPVVSPISVPTTSGRSRFVVADSESDTSEINNAIIDISSDVFESSTEYDDDADLNATFKAPPKANFVTETVCEPRNFREAMSSPQKEEWFKAMKEELLSIEANNTWKPVDLPSGRKTVGSKWVYKIKLDDKGNIARYKARLVAQGFTQKYGVDYDEVFAPVARSTTLRTLLSYSGKQKFCVKQYDIKTAFLNGTLQEEIFMRQPQGFKTNNQVYKLKKSLYGLKQAAKVWNDTLDSELIKIGFLKNEMDRCLYMLCAENKICYLLVHVDDMILSSNDEKLIENVSNQINKKFEMTDLGHVKHYLGIEISKDPFDNYLMSQTRYIEKIIECANLSDAKTSKFPVDTGYFKIEDENFLDNNTEYRKLIGMLLYLTTHSRPDISASVSILSQKLSKPSQTDLNEVKRIIKYLSGTKHLKLRLSFNQNDNNLLAFSDANWAEERGSRKSNSGYICMWNGGAISWSCRRQDIIALSSTEAEYVALAETCKEVMWLKKLIKFFNVTSKLPTTVFTDSQSCLKMIANEKFSNRTKHIDTKFHFSKNCVMKKEIELIYVETSNNVADLFTKPLASTKIKHLRTLAGVISLDDCIEGAC